MTIFEQVKVLPPCFIDAVTKDVNARIARKKRELSRARKQEKQAVRTISEHGLKCAALNEGRASRRKREAAQKQPKAGISQYVLAEQELSTFVDYKAGHRHSYVPQDFRMGAKHLSRQFAGERSRRKVRAPQTRVGRGSIVMGIYVGNYTTVTCKHAM